MGQKSNPISLRLQQTNRHFDSSWYSNYYYTQLISKDINIQDYLNSVLKLIKKPQGRFFIQSLTKKTLIHFFLCNPNTSRESKLNSFQLSTSKKKQKKQRNIALSVILRNKVNKEKNYCLSKKQNLDLDLDLDSNFVFNFTQNNVFRTQNSFLFFLLKLYKNDIKSFVLRQDTKNAISIALDKNLKMKMPISDSKFEKSYKKSFFNSTAPGCNSVGFIGQEKNEIFFKNKNKIIDTFLKQIQSILYKKLELESAVSVFSSRSISASMTKVPTTDNKNSFYFNRKQYHLRYFLLISFFFKKFYKVIKHDTLIHTFSRYQLFNKKKRVFLAIQHLNTIAFGTINAFDSYSKNDTIFFKANQNSSSISTAVPAFSPILLTQELTETLSINSLANKEVDTSLISKEINKNFIKKNFYYKLNKQLNLSLNTFFLFKNLKYQNHFENVLSTEMHSNVELLTHVISQDWQNAVYLVNEIVYYLERRVSFRKIKNKILRDISSNKKIKGFRVACSGRVGGKSKKAQRAKTEYVKYGETSLHVFSGKIDFATKSAQTPFGLVGIKVWICYR